MKNRFSASVFASRPSVLFVLLALTLFHSTLAAAPVELSSGTAKGTFTPKGQPTVTLACAAAFVDVKDEEKPVILLLSDKKLPTEKWTSEFDLMRAHPTFSGVLFWINKAGEVFRTDVYQNGRQSSVGGMFSLQLDSPMGGKELTGTAGNKDAESADHKLDATFHATLK